MNNIYEVAKNSKSIIGGVPVVCSCGEKWFSPFDKLFVAAYGKCISCSSGEEIEKLSGNIFAIIEAAR